MTEYRDNYIVNTRTLCTRCVFLVVVDINECSESFGNNCTENSNCTNTEGSYFCSCLSGYQKDGEKCTGKHAFQTPH